MLRVGLTGELGSGKSTVARLLAGYGAVVISSDEIGRALMQPGESVYAQIVDVFGPGIVGADAQLDRRALARLAFAVGNPRIEELNAIVHPAVLAKQEQHLAALAHSQPDALVVVESALIFSTKHSGSQGGWTSRFDRIVLVTAPDPVKIDRFIARAGEGRSLSSGQQAALREDAIARLSLQRISPAAAAGCIQIDNSGDLKALATRTEEVFRQLHLALDNTNELRGPAGAET